MTSEEERMLLGTALLEVQQVEFAFYGIASHLSHLPEAKGRRFENLNPESFLRGDPEDLKATFGQLIWAFGERLKLTDEDLKRFVKDRNLIAHNYWRMTRPGIRDAVLIESPDEFLVEFINRCQFWKKIVNGLLYVMALAAAKKSGREAEVELDAEQWDCVIAFIDHSGENLTNGSI